MLGCSLEGVVQSSHRIGFYNAPLRNADFFPSVNGTGIGVTGRCGERDKRPRVGNSLGESGL